MILLALLALLTPCRSQAQVPGEYTSLYGTMQTDLTNFDATLNAGWDGSKPPVQFAGELYPATSVSAPSATLLSATIIPYINSLQSLGVRTVKLSINFPVLYQPYYDSQAGANNPAGYQTTLNFYKGVLAELRQRGMKVIIPTQVVFPYEYATTTPYFETLTLAEYSAARSAMAQTIATELQPDYLIVQSEPITEVGNLPAALGAALSNPATDLSMVGGILNDLQKAGLRSSTLLVGAGMGTWQPNFDTFLSGFVALPMDLLDVHVYPINDRMVDGQTVDYLARILQMADAAHAAGMKVGMGECWLNKVSDSELAENTSDQTIPARNVYSFWSPLDQMFLQDMAKAGYWKQFEFINPFWSLYFFSYLGYNQEQSLIQGKSPDAAAITLEQQEDKAAFAAVRAGETTSTGAFYTQLVTGSVSSAPAPVISSAQTASATIGVPFSYQITASGSPSSFACTGLPLGLTINRLGLIEGMPLQAGSFPVALSATNAQGTGNATLTLSVASALPVVTLTAPVARVIAGSGRVGEIWVKRSGTDLSKPLLITYKVGGSAVEGIDYVVLPGTKVIGVGKTRAKISVRPIRDRSSIGAERVVKLRVTPNDAYTVGTEAGVEITIIGR